MALPRAFCSFGEVVDGTRVAVWVSWKKRALLYIMYCSQQLNVIVSPFCAGLGGEVFEAEAEAEAEDPVNVVDARVCDRCSNPGWGVFPRRASRSR